MIRGERLALLHSFVGSQAQFVQSCLTIARGPALHKGYQQHAKLA